MSDLEQCGGISRRTLVKSSAIGSLALAAGGISLPFGMRTAAAAVHRRYNPLKKKWFGEHVLSTAAAAAPCNFTSKMMKSSGLNPTIPGTMNMVSTRFAPACVAALFAAASTIQTDLIIP